MHRPSNVDDGHVLKRILDCMVDVSRPFGIVFPVHPRTRYRIRESEIETTDLNPLDSMSYVEFLSLQTRDAAVVTDSGGIQEETSLGMLCLTRHNTKKPVIAELGTNTLVGDDTTELRSELSTILAGNTMRGRIPSLRVGHASERIADAIVHRMLPGNLPATLSKVGGLS